MSDGHTLIDLDDVLSEMIGEHGEVSAWVRCEDGVLREVVYLAVCVCVLDEDTGDAIPLTAIQSPDSVRVEGECVEAVSEALSNRIGEDSPWLVGEA